MNTSDLMRAASFAAVLLAGSCVSPDEGKGPTVFADGATNHPITVEPSYRTMKVAFSDPVAGLSPEESGHFASFVQDYIDHGNGAITISAARGPGSSEAIDYFGRELVKMGIPRSRILVGTQDVASIDGRVELGYITYVPHTDTCGNWSQDADDTWANIPMPDFGCSVQHNIAAMVADPRDLVSPRDMGPADAVRRATVTKTYETGAVTAATKSTDQSGAVADVNK